MVGSTKGQIGDTDISLVSPLLLVALVDDGCAGSGSYLGLVQQLLEHQRLVPLIPVVVHEDGG